MLSPILRYTLLRFTAFFGCLFVLWLIPPLRHNLVLLVILAAVASMLLSFFFLKGPREEMSAKIDAMATHRKTHSGEGAHVSAEDEEDAEIGESYR